MSRLAKGNYHPPIKPLKRFSESLQFLFGTLYLLVFSRLVTTVCRAFRTIAMFENRNIVLGLFLRIGGVGITAIIGLAILGNGLADNGLSNPFET